MLAAIGRAMRRQPTGCAYPPTEGFTTSYALDAPGSPMRLAPALVAALLVPALPLALAETQAIDTDIYGWLRPGTLTPDVAAPFFVEVQNVGDAAAPAFDATFTVDGEPVATVRVEGIEPWGFVDFQSPPIAVSEGTHLVSVILDSGNEVPETDEENNAWIYDYTWTTRRPDLAVEIVGTSDAWPTGPVRVDYRICNVGDKDQRYLGIVDWQVEAGAPLSGADWGWDTFAPLAVGACHDMTFESEGIVPSRLSIRFEAGPLDWDDAFEPDVENNVAVATTHRGPALL